MIIILGIVLFGIMICFILTRNYKKKYLNELLNEDEKKSFTALYSSILFFLDKSALRGILLNNEKLKEDVRQISMNVKPSDSLLLYYCKKIQMLILVLFFFFLLAFLGSMKEKNKEELKNEYEIEREEYGQGSKSLHVKVAADKIGIETDMNLLIEERTYTEKEIEEQIENCKVYLEKTYLGENISAEEIRSPLHLIKQMPQSPIKISWKSENTEVVEADGTIHNENLNADVFVGLTARLTYMERKEEYHFYVKVLRRILTEEEQVINNIEQLVQNELEQSIYEEKVTLPKKAGDYFLSYSLEKTKSSFLLCILGVISSIAAAVCMDQDLKTEGKKRDQQILMDYPDIMNKFTLLLTAGMTVKGAWGKIAEDYKKQQSRRKRFAYEEMLYTWNEISNQVTENKAYEAFGKRMKLLPYLRFASLLTQNLKKGSAGLLNLLELEAVEAFEEKKELAKRQGEEAGTKLLIPMVIMLLLVFIIIMIPAFQSMV